MVQYARPVTPDISQGGWTPTPLYAEIDEVTPSDTDYISSDGSNGDSCEVTLGTLNDPGIHTGHTVRVRGKRGGGGASLTAYLIQNTTVIASFAVSQTAPFVTSSYTLTTGEAANITDYQDLRIRLTTGAAKQSDVSWAEFEVPDAPYALVASSLVTGTPSIGSSTISQDHAMDPSDLITGAISLETSGISQNHVLTASDLVTGVPDIEDTTIEQIHDLTASDLDTQNPTLGTPVLSESYAMSASNLLLGNPILGPPAISQDHAMDPSDLDTGSPVLGPTTISQLHVLTASDLDTGAIIFETPTLAEEGGNHDLTASDLVTGAISLGTPTLYQEGDDYETAQTGDYDVGSTWEGGFVPPEDTFNIIVKAGHNLTFDTNHSMKSISSEATSTITGAGYTATLTDRDGTNFSCDIDGAVSGTFSLNLTCDNDTNIDINPTSGKISDLTYNATGRIAYVSGSGSELTGNLTVTAGTFRMGANGDTFTVGGNVDIWDILGHTLWSGELSVDGHVWVHPAGLYYGNNNLRFTVTATLRCDNASCRFYNVEMDYANVLTLEEVTGSGQINIENNLTITQGALDFKNSADVKLVMGTGSSAGTINLTSGTFLEGTTANTNDVYISAFSSSFPVVFTGTGTWDWDYNSLFTGQFIFSDIDIQADMETGANLTTDGWYLAGRMDISNGATLTVSGTDQVDGASAGGIVVGSTGGLTFGGAYNATAGYFYNNGGTITGAGSTLECVGELDTGWAFRAIGTISGVLNLNLTGSYTSLVGLSGTVAGDVNNITVNRSGYEVQFTNGDTTDGNLTITAGTFRGQNDADTLTIGGNVNILGTIGHTTWTGTFTHTGIYFDVGVSGLYLGDNTLALSRVGGQYLDVLNSSARFYNVAKSGANILSIYNYLTVENTLSATVSALRFVPQLADVVVTMGTATTAGTIDIASDGFMNVAAYTLDVYISPVNASFPAVIDDNGGGGINWAALVWTGDLYLEDVNYIPTLVTGGNGITVYLEGEMDFDAGVTITTNDTVTATTASMDIYVNGGDWDGGGTFTANTSTVIFDNTVTRYINSSHTFYNITNGGSARLTIAAGNAPTVENLFDNDTTLRIATNATLYLGTASSSGTFDNAGTLQMLGSSSIEGINSSYPATLQGAGVWDWDYGAGTITLKDVNMTVAFTTGGGGVNVYLEGEVDFDDTVTITTNDEVVANTASMDIYFGSHVLGDGTFTPNTSTAIFDTNSTHTIDDGFVFYNLTSSNGEVQQQSGGGAVNTIQNQLTVDNTCSFKVRYGATLTMGTATSIGTIDNGGLFVVANTGTLQGVNSSYLAVLQGAGTWDWDFGAGTITLKDVNMTVAFTTGGGGVTINLEGEMDFDGSFTVSTNDEVVANTASMDIYFGGAWSASGTWTANTSTAIFDQPSTSQYINSDSSVFYNLTVDSGGSFRVNTGLDITIENTLTVNPSRFFMPLGGIVYLGTATSSGTLDNSGTVRIYNGGTLQGINTSYPATLQGAGLYDWDIDAPSTVTLKNLDVQVEFISGGAGVTIDIDTLEFGGGFTLTAGDTLTAGSHQTIEISGENGAGDAITIAGVIDDATYNFTFNFTYNSTADVGIAPSSGEVYELIVNHADAVARLTSGCTDTIETITVTNGLVRDLRTANIDGRIYDVQANGEWWYDNDNTESNMDYYKSVGGQVYVLDTRDLISDTCNFNDSPIADNTEGAGYWVDGTTGSATWTVLGNDALTSSDLVTGVPTIGAPTISQLHVFACGGIATGPPVLGTPTLTSSGDDHNLVASDLVTGAPVLGSPAISQDHAMDPSDLDTGAIVLGTPALSQDHDLDASDLVTGAPVLGTPALSQLHVLDADDLVTGAPILGTPTIDQDHSLDASDLVTGPISSGTPAISQLHVLTAPDLDTGAVVLETPVLTHIGDDHNLVGSDLVTGAISLGTPAISQLHVLTASDLDTGAPVLGTPILTPSGDDYNLVANDLDTGTPVLGTPSISQDHDLDAFDLITGAISLETPVLSQLHVLTASDLDTGAIVLGTPSLTQDHSLTASDLDTGAIVLGTPTLAINSVLIASDLDTGTPVLGTPTITQDHSLNASNLVTNAISLGQPSLSQLQLLVASDLVTGAITLGTPALEEYGPTGLPDVEFSVTIIASISNNLTVTESVEENLTIITSVEGNLHLR